MPEADISGNGISKKKRSKVSRACNNCRRRKIKCTGATPCLNCQTYKCECIYKLPSPTAVGPEDSSLNIRGVPLNTATPGTSAPNSVTPKTKVESASRDSVPPACSSSSSSSLGADSVPVPKTKVFGSLPNGLYEDDSGMLNQLNQLSEILKALKCMQPSARMSGAIQNIQDQMDEIKTSWQPKVRIDAISGVSETATSLETRLMINKYTDNVSLTRFSTIQPSPILSRSSVLNQQPVVDDTFGLYSPGLLLSVRGIGYLFKNFFNPGAKMAREYKTTLYMMLRFFDTCFYYLDLAVKSWSSPVETYYEMISKPLTSKAQSIKDLINEIPESLIIKTREAFPEFPRPSSVDEKLSMFHWLIRLSEVLSVESNPEQFESVEHSCDSSSIESYLRCSEILSVLTFEYLHVTIYTPVGDLDFLESLLILMKHQYWVGEYHFFFQTLSMAVGYAQNLGIHRWEFYVGMDEGLAERRRFLWWRCYCWDKHYAIQTGKQAVINENSVNCLLPKFFRELGFLDSDDFLKRVTTLKGTADGPVLDVVNYFATAISIIMGDFFSNVLYNKIYTDFRNQAKPASFREKLMFDLLEDVETFIERFEAVQQHAQSLDKYTAKFETSSDLPSSGIEVLCKAAGIVVYSHFVLSVCLVSVEHLFARLKIGNFPAKVSDVLGKNRGKVSASWRFVMTAMSRNSIHLMWKIMIPGCVLFLTVLSDLFTQCNEHTIDDIILVLRASRNFDALSSIDDCNNDMINLSRIVRQLMKCQTFFQIMARTSLQLFMRTSHISVIEMLNLIAQQDVTLVATAEALLNGTNKNFKQCFLAMERSSIHLSIERSLEQEQALNSQSVANLELNDQFPPSKVPDLGPTFSAFKTGESEGNERASGGATKQGSFAPPSPIMNFNLGSLDDFLNYGEDDLYNKLWSDINTEFPDFLPQDSLQ
ncbi:LAQU0S07e03202g1_1 [Lachancea quebecensis]|uniref:LAQU0S07e03202g1_1 n=1 Tax=Lachancea quebecensis TaxID=1654605 RepID=A0A0P1KRU9_9SACH|nr:LAQU0S07e03202g1_1 [Lachancea quebecensis]